MAKSQSPARAEFTRYELLHVGKCGGSYLYENLPTMRSTHLSKLRVEPGVGYIIWLRNPITRFVSAFNHSLALVEYDLGNRGFDDLYNDETSPYFKLKNKINSVLATGNPFSMQAEAERYTHLIRYFGSANTLAESLWSLEPEVRAKAQWLMSNKEIEHIARGLGWYTDNGLSIREHQDQIFFVGRQEKMAKDLRELYVRLGLQREPIARPMRQGSAKASKYLSATAVANIKRFYAKTDYKALRELAALGFVKRNLLVEYAVYPRF